ncbi:hypothetical protein N9R54_03540 [Pelobium sp.]|nr:hypothetical protein [Pelobium sp.]MDA9555286.1 hypothetical protein [Pelobium sp.]
MEQLIISVTVGYMLKVLKSKKSISLYKKEFDAIRHGDYLKFINLINGPIPFLAIYNEGALVSGNIPPRIDDISFLLLIKAGPSLKIFYSNCFNEYGKISDPDIKDEIFEMLALFEITLRIHANNHKLIAVDDFLVDVINKLGEFKNMSKEDIAEIQNGRKFLNMVKHYKNQFNSWDEGVIALKKAFTLLDNYNLNI